MKKAVDILEESSYSPAQLEGYDKFWDAVRTERTYYNSARRLGKREGYQEGLEQGHEEGALEERKKNAKAMKALGIPTESISKVIGLSAEEINSL